MPSLSKGGDITKLHAGMHLWLGSQFAGRFIDWGRTLPIARQKDSYSCGICVMNMMERIMVNSALFTHAKCHMLRVRYFIDIMEYLLDMVRRQLPRLLQAGGH